MQLYDQPNDSITNHIPTEKFATFDAERSIIAALLINLLRAEETGLTPFDFSQDCNMQVFSGIRQLTQDGSELDLLTLSNYLQGVMNEFDAPTLSSLANFAAQAEIPYNLKPVIKLIKESSARRRLVRIGSQLKALAEETEESLHEILTQTESRLEDVRKQLGGNARNRRHLSEIAEEMVERYESLYKGDTFNIPTGISDIDRVTRGGIAPGEVWIIGAYTGHGKSALALQMARNQAKQGIKSLLISREMLDVENFERIHSALSEIPLWTIKPNMDERVYSRLKTTLPEVAKQSIWIDSTSSNIFDVRREIKDAVKRDGVQIVYIDYLQLLEVSDKGGMNRTESISMCSKMLKNITIENKIGIVSLAQYNRLANYSGKGENYNFDGASQIEKDASVILHLELEKIEDGMPLPKWRKASIRMGKGRNAPILTTELSFRGEIFTFQDETLMQA